MPIWFYYMVPEQRAPVYGEEEVVDADGDGVPRRGGVTPALPRPRLPPLPAVDAVLGQVENQARSVGDQKHHHCNIITRYLLFPSNLIITGCMVSVTPSS